jgi:hypothetical protein
MTRPRLLFALGLAAAFAWAPSPAAAQPQSPGCIVAWRRAQSGTPARRITQLQQYLSLCPRDRNAGAARAQLRVLQRPPTATAARRPGAAPRTPPVRPPIRPPAARATPAPAPRAGSAPPPAPRVGNAPPPSNEPGRFATVGGWRVMAGQSGCFLSTDFTNGDAFSLGFNRGEGGGAFLLLSSPRWAAEIQSEEEYALTFRFDDQAEWTATGRGFVSPGEFSVLFVDVQEADFLLEFAAGRRLVVRNGEHQLSDLTFSDSDRALVELLRCEDTQTAGR